MGPNAPQGAPTGAAQPSSSHVPSQSQSTATPTQSSAPSRGSGGGLPEWTPSAQTQPQTAEASQAADQAAIEQLLDLDSIPKFKFQGNEMTPEQLQKSFMLQKDYTRKTQEIAKQQKYIENLAADLRKVRRDPSLAGEFKKLYPEAYHQWLELVEQAAAEEMDNSGSSEVPPMLAKQLAEMNKKLEEYDSTIKTLHEREHAANVKEIQSNLDKLFDGFNKKYDMANEAAVLAKAEALIQQGYKMTDAAWERLWKEDHGRNEANFSKRYESKIKKQLDAGKEGSDIGRGGGTPSPAKRKMSIRDVTDHMIASLSKSQA